MNKEPGVDNKSGDGEMPRPKLKREIEEYPTSIRFESNDRVETKHSLTYEEREALRLKDLCGLEQSQAAAKMKISQPTFHRVLLKARKKSSSFLCTSGILSIEGGNYRFKE